MADRYPLNMLLPDRLDSLADQVKKRLCEDEEVGRKKLAWDFVGKQLGASLMTALDCDLIEMMAAVWAKAAPLADLADPARHPPGERSLVELGEHDISRDFHPMIAVTIGACPCVEMKFTLAVAAHVGGVRLAVVDGHIIGGDLGELWASGQLSYEGMPLHPPTKSRKLALPAEFGFDPPGIRIPRVDENVAPGG